MSTATEFLKALQEGFVNKDSSRCGEFMTDDWEFITGRGTRDKQWMMDWIARGGNPTSIGDLEMLYENDEAAVGIHSAKNPENNGQVMFFARIQVGKFSHWRIVRAVISD